MDFRQGQRVFVEGDASEICTANYTTRVSSSATVVDEPNPDDEYILLNIDKIGGDRHVWVYVLKSSVRPSDIAC